MRRRVMKLEQTSHLRLSAQVVTGEAAASCLSVSRLCAPECPLNMLDAPSTAASGWTAGARETKDYRNELASFVSTTRVNHPFEGEGIEK
jgi:hypothetical protein